MDISKVNGLLDKVRIKLESIGSAGIEENIEKTPASGDTSISAANGRLAHLMSKLTAGRSKKNKLHVGKRK